MILFPAVDIKGGKCVRLRQGRANAETVFGHDPAAMARHWVEQGATWLHVIDLDGSFDGLPVNQKLVAEICASVPVPVQLGGGVRDLAIAKSYLDAGVTRLIIGTVALEQPDLFAAMCDSFPGQIGVSLGAENGRLKTRGWVADSGLTVDDVLPRLHKAGAAFLIYTDISRDGTNKGVNLGALTDLAKKSPIPVLAAGGVHTLEDIKALYPLWRNANLEGAITGQAIYEGTLSVKETMDWLNRQQVQA